MNAQKDALIVRRRTVCAIESRRKIIARTARTTCFYGRNAKNGNGKTQGPGNGRPCFHFFTEYLCLDGYTITRVLITAASLNKDGYQTTHESTQALVSATCVIVTSARELLYEDFMNTLMLLQLLGKAWVVTLTCLAGDDQWQLHIESHPAPRWNKYFSYTYRGSLTSVVDRAYAGEPDDAQVKEAM